VLAVAGCGSASPVSGGGVGEPPLAGTAWQLASYQDSVTAAPVRVKTDSTIAFSPSGRFSAHACNYIGGAARIDGHTITFGQGISTAMACKRGSGPPTSSPARAR
jgi:heat shock protein HslJ